MSGIALSSKGGPEEGLYLFHLNAHITKTAENFAEREHVLDQLLIGGQCAARPKGNAELATLRAELLSTYLDGAVEKYRFHIW